MRITKLQAENIKRVTAIDITPAEHVQVITGKNAQGKSSVLDAIWLALGGREASKTTAKPVRAGQENGHVTLELDDLIVTRTWTKNGEATRLTVSTREGARHTSPQAMLDKLTGRFSFDPLAFTRLDAKGQRDALLSVVALPFDPDALATERAEAFDTRTAVGRNLKVARGHLDSLPVPPAGTPDEFVSAGDILDAIAIAEATNRAADDAAAERDRLDAIADTRADDVATLEQQLARARALAAQARECADAAGSAADAAERVDVAPLRARLASLEETNQHVRDKQARDRAAAAVTSLSAERDELTGRIEELDRVKAQGLADAEFPVAGLGFDEVGVTYQGQPFSQSSSAEQIKVSLAMAMALNPELRVIRIMDGSLLDEDSMAVIRDMAEKHDFQVWIETVGGSTDPAAVVIEDGRVKK